MTLFEEIAITVLKWSKALGLTTLGSFTYFGADEALQEITVKINKKIFRIKVTEE